MKRFAIETHKGFGGQKYERRVVRGECMARVLARRAVADLDLASRSADIVVTGPGGARLLAELVPAARRNMKRQGYTFTF